MNTETLLTAFFQCAGKSGVLACGGIQVPLMIALCTANKAREFCSSDINIPMGLEGVSVLPLLIHT